MSTRIAKQMLLPAVLAGLCGISSTAFAQTFPISAAVQNAITITEVTPLNFGTVFATTTATGTAGPLTAASGHKLTLSSSGAITITNGSAVDGGAIVSLGSATAGSYMAPGLPSNATVRITFTNSDGEDFTPAASVAAAECVYDTPAAALAARKIILTHSVGDPSIGFFCVDVFTSNRSNLFSTGFQIGFGATQLTFNLGATLLVQVPSTNGIQRSFQAGSYSGTFGMELGFL